MFIEHLLPTSKCQIHKEIALFPKGITVDQ